MGFKWVEAAPCLVIDEGGKRYLVLSDLHIGIEGENVDRGVHLPSMLPALLGNVRELVVEQGVDSLLLLGDVKHRVAGVSWREARQLREFVSQVRRLVDEVIIVPGNHDVGVYSLTEGMATIAPSRGLGIGDLWLLHGHTWPHPESLSKDLIIIGHTHPVLRMVEENVAVRQRVYLLMKTRRSRLYEALIARPGYGDLVRSYSKRGYIRLLVMPHFNPAAGGVEVGQLVFSRMGSPLLRSGVFDMGDALIVTQSGVVLNSVREFVSLSGGAS